MSGRDAAKLILDVMKVKFQKVRESFQFNWV